MKFTKTPQDYSPLLTPSYRHKLALWDNVANAIIAGVLIGAALVALYYFRII